MGGRYLKLLPRGYLLALLPALVLRTILVFFYTDVQTGLYTHYSPLFAVLQVLLTAVVAALFFSSRLRRADNDYPLGRMRGGRMVSLFAILAGLGIFAQTFWDAPFPLADQMRRMPLVRVGAVLSILFGTLTCVSFLWLGCSGFIKKLPLPHAALMLSAPLWQMCVLITRFNGYTTLVPIMDNLLAVLFMVFSSLFWIGHARTVCGFTRRDSRNYTIPSGLCAAMFGLLLVLPNYLYMALHFTGRIPAPLLLPMESIAVLFTSLYALLFCMRLLRSIHYV